MRYAFLMIVALSLLLAGCGTLEEMQTPSDASSSPDGVAGDAVVNTSVEDDLVGDDLDDALSGIDLDDW
ncbi:hypothetical protein GF367_00615 [Candidatus Woesearchaeota archaeon]|nr:hypothetical protein [Candidatus Woesearchaeota archaeon]